MKITSGKITAAILIGLGIGVFINLGRAQNKAQPSAPIAIAKESVAKTETGLSSPKVSQAAAIAPFIVKDTDNDSPETNMVTRIVTITAEIGGTPPVALQWKVDHGNGFESIAGATNATFRIGNAQVANSGLYSLFATNAAGHLNTTPVPLIVIEVAD